MSVPAPPKNIDAKNQNSLGAQVPISLIVGVLVELFAWWLPADVSQKKKNIIFIAVIFIGIVIIWILIETERQKRTQLLPIFIAAIVIVCIAVSMRIWAPQPLEPPTTLPTDPTLETPAITPLISDTGVKLEFPKYIILADTAVLASIVIVWIWIKTNRSKRSPLLPLFAGVIVIGCLAVLMSIWDPQPPKPSTPLTTDPTPETTTIPALFSDTGVMLEFPKDTEYVETPFEMYLGEGHEQILLMPKPKSENGHLVDEVNVDEVNKEKVDIFAKKDNAVTILAQRGDFYFFKTKDGYYGWNGKYIFTSPPP